MHRLYTSSMLMTTLVGNAKILQPKMLGKAKYYGTSVAIKAVLGDTTSDQARRFFQRGSKLYTVLPGVVDPYEDPPFVPSAETQRGTYNNEQMQQQQLQPSYYEQSQQHVSLPRSPQSRAHSPVHRTQSAQGDRRDQLRSREHSPNRRQDSHNTDLGLAVPDDLPDNTGTRQHSAQSPSRRHAFRHLDFHNLFGNQPEADYFPNGAHPEPTAESTTVNENSTLVPELSLASLFPPQVTMAPLPAIADSNNRPVGTDRLCDDW